MAMTRLSTKGQLVVPKATRERMGLTPGTSFNLTPGKPSRHVRVCFGGPQSGHLTRKGFEIIRELMNSEPEDDFTPVA